MDSLASSVIIIIAFAIPLIYSCVSKSRKTCTKPPPPKAAGAWPLIGHLHLLGGSEPTYKTLGKLADKHGPIFTIDIGVHRTLIVSNVETARECFTINDKAFSNRPQTLATEILGYDYSMMGFCPYGEFWRQIRKIVTLELLSKHRLEKLKHVREAEVKAGIKALFEESNSKNIIEMKKWFLNVTLNVILKIMVGKRYVEYANVDHQHHDEESEIWRGALRKFMELSAKFSVSDALPYLRRFDFGGVEKEMKQNVKDLDGVVRKWLEERKEKRSSGTAKGDEDFMDALLTILDDAKPPSHLDADTINKSTCLALILAASDTTAITMSWTLSLLLNHPEALKRVQHELDVHVGRERQVTESDTNNLVFLQAVIKESMRLYPAAPLLIPRESMEECSVNGYHIPAGTRLTINASKIQRDPAVWSNPDEFQPERFLTTHKDVDFRGQHIELIPFGSGRRVCPGITFGLQVLNLTFTTLLHSFEIQTLSGNSVDMTESPGITNMKLTPVEVLLTPRLPSHLY